MTKKQKEGMHGLLTAYWLGQMSTCKSAIEIATTCAFNGRDAKTVEKRLIEMQGAIERDKPNGTT